MCLARVRLLEVGGGEDDLMSDVARIEVTANGLAATDLVGETRTVQGTLKSIDFMDSVVVVERGKD
jgi:predicted RNA-binding protein